MVIFEWYDHAREGVVALSHPPSEWHFRVIGSRENTDGSDDLLYLLSSIPDGMVDRIRMALGGERTPEIFIPDGTYETEAARAEGDRLVNEALEHFGRDAAIVHTNDLRYYRAVWSYV
ncbi:hypothetical protein ACH35V_36020 [Actinomadura sp. 1N219]|uniref:hypothetical protein n=1 Tax=Actinomadura sp. 1N219 TaxID=3375152 RepID=UPI0037A9BDB9